MMMAGVRFFFLLVVVLRSSCCAREPQHEENTSHVKMSCSDSLMDSLAAHTARSRRSNIRFLCTFTEVTVRVPSACAALLPPHHEVYEGWTAAVPRLVRLAVPVPRTLT